MIATVAYTPFQRIDISTLWYQLKPQQQYCENIEVMLNNCRQNCDEILKM